jgi:hypothetical protein
MRLREIVVHDSPGVWVIAARHPKREGRKQKAPTFADIEAGIVRTTGVPLLPGLEVALIGSQSYLLPGPPQRI